MSTGRAEAFSDGVFAVAITVLVFGLLPIGTGKLDANVLLVQAWPEYFAYVVSFPCSTSRASSWVWWMTW